MMAVSSLSWRPFSGLGFRVWGEQFTGRLCYNCVRDYEERLLACKASKVIQNTGVIYSKSSNCEGTRQITWLSLGCPCLASHLTLEPQNSNIRPAPFMFHFTFHDFPSFRSFRATTILMGVLLSISGHAAEGIWLLIPKLPQGHDSRIPT